MSKFEAVFAAKQKAQEEASSSIESPPVARDSIARQRPLPATTNRLSPSRRSPQSASNARNLARAQNVDPKTEINSEEPVLVSETTKAHDTRRPGRPNAKRSDPDFVQTTAYIRKATHRDVKLALLQNDEGRDFSELVEELLATWVKEQNAYSNI